LDRIGWQKHTDEAIDGIVFGIVNGFYDLSTDQDVFAVVEAKVREIYPDYDDGKESAFSLMCGFFMGQVGERLKRAGEEKSKGA
jgi:hypothetical protein